MSQTTELNLEQKIGLGIFLITTMATALDMGGFWPDLKLGLPIYLAIATVGGIVGGAVMAVELRWAGAFAGALAAPCGVLTLAWWVTGREKVYGVDVVLVEMIAAGIPGGIVFFGLQSIVKVRGRVTVDDVTITYQSPQGDAQSFPWADLEAVEIEATTKIFGSLRYVLKGPTGTLNVPEDAKGFAKLRDRLEELSGWDNEALISALEETAPATLVAWRKQGKIRN